jgi:hypothetical protein
LDFTPSERRSVIIDNNIIYRHKVLRVNYTTYDMRRAQDSLNPRVSGHADIMVLSPENEEDNKEPHPYWYARILGIFHANIRYIGPNSISQEPVRMEFLFVRWFGRDPTLRPGWKSRRLFRLGFVPGNDGSAFGFLDPNQVIFISFRHSIGAVFPSSTYLDPQSLVVFRIRIMTGSYTISECMSL